MTFTPRLSLLLISTLWLASCASAPKVTRTPVAGGESVSIPGRGITLMLPTGWQVLPKAPKNTLFLAGADNGNLRFAFISPPGRPKGRISVADPRFQQRVKAALQASDYTRITRSEVMQLNGCKAYVCAASVGSTAESTLQAHLFHQGKGLLLAFFSTQHPITQVASVQAILKSLRLAP